MPVRRKLRFTADIRTPDLETPRRRKECLKIIRFENTNTKTQNRSLKKQNTRLKAKVKSLKGLLLRLQEKELLSARGAAKILVRGKQISGSSSRIDLFTVDWLEN